MGLLLIFCIWDLGYATMNDSLLSFMTTQRRTLDPGHRDTHLSIRLRRQHDLHTVGSGFVCIFMVSFGGRWRDRRHPKARGTVAGGNRRYLSALTTRRHGFRRGPSVCSSHFAHGIVAGLATCLCGDNGERNVWIRLATSVLRWACFWIIFLGCDGQGTQTA